MLYILLAIGILGWLLLFLTWNRKSIKQANQEESLLNLISSDKYKNSGYKIQKINNDYYILNYGYEYVDLKNNSYRWRFNTRFYKDCKGSLNDVIKAFNELNPDIETIISKQEY